MLPSLLECLTVPRTSPRLPGLLLAEPPGTACIIRGFFPFKINPPQLARTPVVLLQQHLPTESPSFSHSSLPAPAPKSVLVGEGNLPNAQGAAASFLGHRPFWGPAGAATATSIGLSSGGNAGPRDGQGLPKLRELIPHPGTRLHLEERKSKRVIFVVGQTGGFINPALLPAPVCRSSWVTLDISFHFSAF